MTDDVSPQGAAPSPLSRTVNLFLPAAGGTEALLAEEVQRLTGQAAQAGRGGVWTPGDGMQAMQLNLESRIAQRVLWPLVDGPYRDEHDLYDLARRVPWPDWITPAQTLRVDVNAQGSPLRSVNFAALRIKDAVCDVMREATGERPSVDTRHPDLPLVRESVSGFDVKPWHGLMAPAGTPPAIVNKLSEEVQAFLRTPAAQTKLQDKGIVRVGNSAEQFQAFMASEFELYKKVIQDAGIKAD